MTQPTKVQIGVLIVASMLAALIGHELGGTSTPASDAEPALHANVSPVPQAGNLPVYNIVSYGAKGDGTTNDQTAIGNALTAACANAAPNYRSIVYFPAPSVAWTATTITLPCGNLMLMGIPGISVIRQPTGLANASNPMMVIGEFSNVTLWGLVLDGNWGNASSQIAAASDQLTLPLATIAVVDTSQFPSTGGTFVIMSPTATNGTVANYVTCTGKTSTTLTGCSGGTREIFYLNRIGFVDALAGINQATQSTVDTTVALASDGTTLPTATINVASSAGFPAGTYNISIKSSNGYQRVTCTGTGTGTLTGCACTYTTGGSCSGTIHTGFEVFPTADVAPQNHGLELVGASSIDLEFVRFRDIYGDCIHASNPTDGSWNTYVTVTLSRCDLAAGNGVTFAGGAADWTIRKLDTTAIAGTAITSASATNFPVRNIHIEDGSLSNWWQGETIPPNPLSIVGSTTPSQIISTDARGWRVKDVRILGAVNIFNATDLVMDGDRITEDTALDSTSPIWISGQNSDIVMANLYVQTRAATSGTDGASDCCGVLIGTDQYVSGGTTSNADPATIKMIASDIHVSNGRMGVAVVGAGGKISATSGTATSVTSSTMVDTSCSWTTNQWRGALVTLGQAQAAVLSNTASPGCTLTLNPVWGAVTSWQTSTGDEQVTPSTGSYTIQFLTGLIDVADTTVSGLSNGFGGGGFCFEASTAAGVGPNTRIRFHHDQARDCGTDAFHLQNQVGSTMPYVEFTDGTALDDQASPTTTNAFGMGGTLNVTKMVLRNNIPLQGVTNETSGLTAGTWLVFDGNPPEWAGFGSPAGVVTAPPGSTYQNLSGGSTTTLFVKESGTGTSGWVGK